MQCDVFYVVCVFSTSFVNLLQTNGRLTDIVRSFQTLMPSLHLLGKVGSHVTPPPVGEQSIAMSVSVSVCLFVSLCLLSISQKPDVQTLPNLDACCLWPWSCVLTALQSINQSISAVRYVLRVSWNTSFCARDRPRKGCSSSAYTQSDSPGVAPVRRQSWCLRLPCRWNVSYVGLENSSNAICWHRVAVWSYTGL